MLRSLRTFPLLVGYRGAPPADMAALEDVLLRLAALAEAHPEIAELECNPVVAAPGGALAVDARVRVRRAPPRLPEPARAPRRRLARRQVAEQPVAGDLRHGVQRARLLEEVRRARDDRELRRAAAARAAPRGCARGRPGRALRR